MSEVNSSAGNVHLTRSIAIVGLLFFIMGFFTWINGPLITFVRLAFDLNDVNAFLILMVFYLSYFFFALPASWILKGTGLKKGLALSLVVLAAGAALFGELATRRWYPGALGGLFVIGGGLALLQTAVNPYVCIIGPIESAARRIAVMGICSKSAGVLAPLVIGSLVLQGIGDLASRLETADAAARAKLLDAFAAHIHLPYMIMAGILLLVAVGILASPLPEINASEVNAAPVRDVGDERKSIFRFPHLWLGVLCIFVCIGAEVMAGDAIGTYGRGFDLPLDQTRFFTSFTLGAMLLGYLAGLALIPRFISQERYLSVSALLGMALAVGAFVTHGYVSVGFVAVLGFANAIMWPAIFPLAIRGLGRLTEIGSALLVMGITGGAVIPQAFAVLKQHYDFQAVFAALMVPCYLYVLYYAWHGHRVGLSRDAIVTNSRVAGFIGFLVLASCTLSLPGNLRAQEQSSIAIMPLPAHVMRGEGEFLIDGGFGIALKGYKDARLKRAQQRFLDTLSRETGIPFRREAIRNSPHFTLQTSGPSAAVQQLGEDESYHLEISATDVQLTAPNPIGAIRGLQTFLQLVRITPKGFSVPVVTVDDKPRFPWRGLLIDSGHRFVPISTVKRNLDGMEAVKLNVFHWRFADNQGFHVESKKFPKLQEKGSGSFYYSQDEVREIVAYARDRGIRVVPEFDMPCHTTSWFLGYPELAGGQDPSQSTAMDPTRESTYKFLAGFIGEMAALFPDSYFHTGGDECDVKQWETNPRIQEFMRAHAIKDGGALQALFTARIQKIVAGHKKIMEGWDEVLQSHTPKDVVIQSWRGQDSLAEAARSGYRGVLSAGYYIDLNQSAAEHYLVDPLGDTAATLAPDQKARVLGGEATMWTDIVSDENIDNRIWPRTAAIAERLWSPQQVQDVDWMYRRLAIVSQKLGYYGLRHRLITDEMLQRMSGDPDPVPLKVLAAVVQPPRLYERQQLRTFTDYTPLNHLDDAVPPESDTAREFNEIAKRIVSGKANPQEWQQARQWLLLWRDNDAKLQPLLARSYLTQELAPVSRSLSRVAEIGLQALDNLHENRLISPDLRQRNIEFLKASGKPQAVLLLMVAPSVELLVQATRTQ